MTLPLRVHVDGIGEVVVPVDEHDSDAFCIPHGDWTVDAPGERFSTMRVDVSRCIENDSMWSADIELQLQVFCEADTPEEALRKLLIPVSRLLSDTLKARLRGENG